jgi:hypothetical protein
MTKSLLYRLFGIGKIPVQLKAQMEIEGIRLQDEGIPGSVTYRNFRRPGRYSSWRRTWNTASLIVTQTRLVAPFYSRPAIDVPFADKRFPSLTITLEKAGTLQVTFGASLFCDNWSGEIEYRFNTPQAQEFLEILNTASA